MDVTTHHSRFYANIRTNTGFLRRTDVNNSWFNNRAETTAFLLLACVIIFVISGAMPRWSPDERDRMKRVHDKLSCFMAGLVVVNIPLWLAIPISLLVAGRDIIDWIFAPVFAKIASRFRGNRDSTSIQR